MLQFQPCGFGQRVLNTALGVVAYYTPTEAPWRDERKEPGTQNGSGKTLKPLVFFHSLGGGSSAYEWSKVYPAFAFDHRVVAPDLIGWGQSTHPVRDYQPDDYINLMIEILERLEEPADVVASSLTGGLSIRVAIARPDLVRSLFLVCPSGYADFGADYRRGLAAQVAGIPLVDRALYSVGAANEFAVRTFLQQVLFADPSRISEEMVAAYLTSALQPNAEYAALSSLKGALFFDLALYLRQLATPAAFVWGSQSRFNSPTMGRRLAALNPEQIKEFYELPEVGVLPQLEMPAAVIGLLQEWLKSQ